ncbi:MULTISPECIES: DUF3263 domain-containing protein [Rhodococcus]|uniref:DUF3263 domain-containing protein n=1 Tax=Rhodococcus TaxID=1827 RepID=UPI000B2BFCB4|nr:MULTISPECIES: DUF3263 domain-containing protein [Rhodococcus]QQZ14628.1 DUF3263 domain-containing protein [Rhodococcus sp. 21391]
MTDIDYSMIKFAQMWSHYGGGDEYILPEFGISPALFYQRLHQTLEKRFIEDLDLTARLTLRDFCAVKLTRYGVVPVR